MFIDVTHLGAWRFLQVGDNYATGKIFLLNTKFGSAPLVSHGKRPGDDIRIEKTLLFQATNAEGTTDGAHFDNVSPQIRRFN